MLQEAHSEAGWPTNASAGEIITFLQLKGTLREVGQKIAVGVCMGSWNTFATILGMIPTQCNIWFLLSSPLNSKIFN